MRNDSHLMTYYCNIWETISVLGQKLEKLILEIVSSEFSYQLLFKGPQCTNQERRTIYGQIFPKFRIINFTIVDRLSTKIVQFAGFSFREQNLSLGGVNFTSNPKNNVI